MKTFTITVPDAVGARILKAFGHQEIGEDMKVTSVDATPAEVEDELKDFLRQRVRNTESAAASTQVQAKVNAETW